MLNKDIGFIQPGQHVTVKVESFPYTRHGYLDGTVESVSADAAQDEYVGPVFPIRVRLARATLNVGGKQIRITPGMSLSAEIKIGRRRVISYLLTPLERQMSEGLRER